MNKKYLPVAIFSTFAVALTGGFFLSSVLQPAEDKGIIESALVSDPSLSITKPADIHIALSPSTTLYGAASHSLKFTTNQPEGYTVSINTKTSTTALTSETTDGKISASASPISSPSALLENTWGFAVKKSINSAFDDAYSAGTPDSASKWAGVTATATTFIDSDSPNLDGDAVEVFFAANVSRYVEAGTYNNTIVYTILPKTSSSAYPAPTISSVTPNFGPVTGGEEITIVGTGYTVNGSSITKEVLIGGNACTDVVILADTPEAGKDTIKCKIPEAATTGTVDIKITTWGGETTTDFKYDTSDIIYVTPNIASVTPGAESGPAFTIYGGGFDNAENPVVAVYIGAQDDAHKCESFTVVSDTQITCTKGPNGGDTTSGARRVYAVHQNTARSGGNISVTYHDTDYPVLNGSTDLATICTTEKTIVRDARDSQLYYVARMADGKCWMVDNLKYANYGTLSQTSGKALTVDQTTASTTGNYEVAKFVDPNIQNYCMGDSKMPSSTVTRCGLLYNWYAATAGTGNDTLTTVKDNANDSICPAKFKLPSSISNSATTYGEEVTFADADFPVLIASLNAGTITAGTVRDNSHLWQANLQPSAVWQGVFGGFWNTNFAKVGTQAYYWSSSVATKDGKLRAHFLSFHTGEVFTGDESYSNDTRNYGFAVRCVEK